MKKPLFLAVIIFSTLFISCGKKSTRFYLDDNVMWARGTFGNTVFPSDLEFQKLTDFKSQNLERLVGREGSYIWLKIDFEIPENLKGTSLGFVVPYLHYADKTYLNGQYVGGYGSFPPNEFSAQYVSHFYILPYEDLEQNGTNTLLINVWVHGKGTICDKIFIDDYVNANLYSDIITFLHSKIYMFFVSGLLISFIVFSMLGTRNDTNGQSMRILAAINMTTVLFLAYFFAPEIPIYQFFWGNNCIAIKIFLCTTFYCISFHITTFVVTFIGFKEPPWLIITRMVFLLFCLIITYAARDYNALMKICPYTLCIALGQLGVGVYAIVRSIYIPEKKLRAYTTAQFFSPLLISGVMDCIVRNIFKDVSHSFFAIYGWMFTIVFFIVYLGKQYKKTAQQNEYLTHHLEEEVKLKTVDLTFANEKLEQEITNSSRDMEMAAIVQHKFYPQNENFFDGWELSICFDPMSKISGDLYDYYSTGTTLNGLGLFDASGHGVSASLVCMLAKSIIFRAFVQGRGANETMAVILERINDHLIEDKGEVQNYLTGVLLRLGEFDVDGKCLCELSSAGHPYPIFYSSETDEMIQITHDEYQEQYGALGIRDMDVSFPNVDLTISEGDVLVLFTDGVTEAQNENGEEFGTERLSKIIYKNRKKNARQIQDAIVKSLKEYTTGLSRTDDITFIVLRRVPRWEK